MKDELFGIVDMQVPIKIPGRKFMVPEMGAVVSSSEELERKLAVLL